MRHIANGLEHASPISMDGTDVAHQLTLENPRAGTIQIRVKDSGIGLTQDQLKQLFGEGVQFDANKLQHGGGFGLGLAITKGIIEQHSGTIKAESDGPGCGTAFVIDLPAYDTPLDKLPTECDSSDGSSPQTDSTSPAISNRRILVVEDVLASSKMLVKLLERTGHSCATATNGELAVRAVEVDMAKAARIATTPLLTPFLWTMKVSNDESRNTCVCFRERRLCSQIVCCSVPILNGPEAAEQIRNMGFKAIIFGVTVSPSLSACGL